MSSLTFSWRLQMAEIREFYKEVGRRIRKARIGRHLTQDGLGAMVSLSRTSITNVEGGRQKLLLHKLAEIADALKVGIGTLVPENENSKENELDRALSGRSEEEKQWIKAAVASTDKGRES